MDLIQCPKCLNQIASVEESCPHCGTPISRKDNTPYYEYKSLQVTCWGRPSAEAVVKKIQDEKDDGWSIVSIMEDHLHSGLLRHVVKVVLEREIQ